MYGVDTSSLHLFSLILIIGIIFTILTTADLPVTEVRFLNFAFLKQINEVHIQILYVAWIDYICFFIQNCQADLYPATFLAL